METYNREEEVAVSIAKEAGEIILKYFDIDQEVEKKADNSFVTIADKEINTLVIARLREAFPEDGVIGEEESTSEYGMGRKWFCDPVDGTAAYVWGVPTAMFSLALVVDGRPVLGVAYDAFLDRMYTAKVGGKSYCNGKELKVSNLDMKSGIFALTGNIKILATADYFKRMVEDKIRVAFFSGAVYKDCLIARGKFVGHMSFGINAHDIAATHVIVEAAGGKVTGLRGERLDFSRPFRGAIVSNGVTHDEIMRYCA